MTKKQFNEALKKLGIDNNIQAAAVLGISRRSVIRYVHGQAEVTENVRRLIDMYLKHGIPKEHQQ